eukprot:10190997-Alexandrium_andersonii.AAC.1
MHSSGPSGANLTPLPGPRSSSFELPKQFRISRVEELRRVPRNSGELRRVRVWLLCASHSCLRVGRSAGWRPQHGSSLGP